MRNIALYEHWDTTLDVAVLIYISGIEFRDSTELILQLIILILT